MPEVVRARNQRGRYGQRPTPIPDEASHIRRRLAFVREVLSEAAGRQEGAGPGEGSGSEGHGVEASTWHGVEASTWHAELVPVFDPAVSPRNTALVAWRRV